MQKFYDMETMTKEKLNKLVLERNTLEKENKYLSDKVVKYTEVVDHQAKVINELEKWIKENNLGKYRTENVVDTDELLDKLKELKEDQNE